MEPKTWMMPARECMELVPHGPDHLVVRWRGDEIVPCVWAYGINCDEGLAIEKLEVARLVKLGVGCVLADPAKWAVAAGKLPPIRHVTFAEPIGEYDPTQTPIKYNHASIGASGHKLFTVEFDGALVDPVSVGSATISQVAKPKSVGCIDCKWTGFYVGLNEREPCKTCQGGSEK